MTHKPDSLKHRDKAERKRKRSLEAYARMQRVAALAATSADTALAPFSLSASQFGVLETLHTRGPLHQQELARTLGRSKAQMTAIIDALEKRALAQRERHATDRRFTTVHISEAGTTLLMEVMPLRSEAIVATMSALSGEQKTKLSRFCRRLLRALAPEEADREEADREDAESDADSDGDLDGHGDDADDDVTDELEAVGVPRTLVREGVASTNGSRANGAGVLAAE